MASGEGAGRCKCLHSITRTFMNSMPLLGLGLDHTLAVSDADALPADLAGWLVQAWCRVCSDICRCADVWLCEARNLP
eukprot:2512722-Pleurochrysis_carterae.AAC.4